MLTAPGSVAGQLIGSMVAGVELDPRGAGTVVFVEAHKFGEIDGGQASAAPDLQEVFVILVDGVFRHVGGAGEDNWVAGFGVDDNELVMDDDRRKGRTLFAWEELPFVRKSGGGTVPMVEVGPDDITLIFRAMVEFDGGGSISTHVLIDFLSFLV